MSLSRGGSDASEIREFDTVTKQWIRDGFTLREAKSSTGWIDENTVLVGTDFGAGSMTTSGYARTAKLWKRGTPLASAETVLEIPAADMGLFVGSYDAGGRKYFRLSHQKNFYESTQYLYEKGQLVKIDVPADADPNLLRSQIIVFVRTPWEVGGRKWNTGSLIAMPVDDFLAGKREFRLVAEPGSRESINGVSVTRDFVLVSVLNNVKGELRRYRFENGEWRFEKIPAPEMGTVSVSATSPYSNAHFFSYTSFVQPTTLYFADEKGAVREVKRLPVMWDSSGMKVEQFDATSKDGTRIPFFVVRQEGQRADGTNPTLLYAYGGFELASTPSYATTMGAAWLDGEARTCWRISAAAASSVRSGIARVLRRIANVSMTISLRWLRNSLPARSPRRGTSASWAAATADSWSGWPSRNGRNCSMPLRCRYRCSICSAIANCWPGRAGWLNTATRTSPRSGRTFPSTRPIRMFDPT